MVIEGGRGTGKSTVFLCNCWRNQLAAAENDPAKTIDSFLNKKSVGLYYKVDGAFLSAMDTNSRALQESTGIFNTYLSVELCKELFSYFAAISTRKNIIGDVEYQKIQKAYNRSVRTTPANNLLCFEDLIDDCDNILNAIEDCINYGEQITDSLIFRITSAGSIFKSVVEEILKLAHFSDVTFRVFIDEFESLCEWQQKQVNTLIKQSNSYLIYNICMKINLLAAAKRHYPEVKITGVDIDPAAHAHCIEGATFVCDDGRSFANRQEKAKQTYDLVLSNPPFGPLSKKKKKYRKAGNVFTTSKRYEAELLWANLKLMHTDSFLIIILPSTYMNGSSYIECRKWLAHNYNIHAIVKLPSNTFEKATLNTVAIILQKVEPCATYVYNTATSVYQAHYDSKWSIKLSFSITLRRILDGTWDNNSYTLAEDQHLQIYRGNISSKYFSKTGDVILHCSSTFVNNSWMPGLRYCTGTKASQRKYLNHGDIVINRIGRCAGYWSVYTGMQKLISDCLIVVKEPSDATIEALRNHSENGRLQIPLRGVSTPYITIDDVRSLLLNN